MSEITLTQAQLDEKINLAVSTAVEGLKKKNKELIGDLSKFKDINLEQLTNDSTELKKLREKSEKDKGEWEKLYNDLKKVTDTDKQKLSEQITTLNTKLVETRRDNTLANVIASSGVLPPYADTVRKLLTSDMVPKEDGSGFLIQGKEIQSFVDEWKQSDVGKVFFDEGNRGGNAHGDGGSGSPPELDYFKKDSKNFSLTKQAEIRKKDPEKYKVLKKSAG